MMKKILLYTALTATAMLFTATDSLAYSNECVKSGSGSDYYITCYDSNGNQTSKKYYEGDPDSGASVSTTQIWTYDANGNQTSKKNYDGDPDKGVSVSTAQTYTYDSNGKRSAYKWYFFNSDGSGTVNNYTCDGSYSAKCGGVTLVSTETLTAEQYASILASFPTNYIAPKTKRTYYTLEEAMGHLSHDNNNRVIFTFK